MPVIAPEALKDLIYSILTEQQIKTLEKELELDFAYSISGVSRFRGNILYQRGTLGAAFRSSSL